MLFLRPISIKRREMINLPKNCVVFTYPKMGDSGKFLPEELRGAAGLTGCTLQCKAYENAFAQIRALGFELIAVGSMGEAGTSEFKRATGATFEFINDEKFELEAPLRLETFTTGDGKKFYHRQTLIFRGGKEVKRFSRIKGPEQDAQNVLAALKSL